VSTRWLLGISYATRRLLGIPDAWWMLFGLILLGLNIFV